MDLADFIKASDYEWHYGPVDHMRVPAIIFGSEALICAMDDHVLTQLKNVASLRGIVKAAYAMPDAHWGYGFPIGGVAAFDASNGGVISAGGVGFDISCGVRTLTSGLHHDEVKRLRARLADALFGAIPAGMGKRSKSRIELELAELDAMLGGGAKWAVSAGYGVADDLSRTEEFGCMAGATPEAVSQHSKERQLAEVGTLGSGNHYLEVQYVEEIYDPETAKAFDLEKDSVVVTIHCGSRGLGHQIGTEYLGQMAKEALIYGIELPDRELACVPINSPTGQKYLGVMRAAINCALANRQVLTHLVRQVFAGFFPRAKLNLLYDVSHNTCKVETHIVNGRAKELHVHRKGATRAFGPGHAVLPMELKTTGQPVLIGGSMGTSSYVLAGSNASEQAALSSSCHGAGRSMSRHHATTLWSGRAIIKDLANQGIEVRSHSYRGIAEEAPGAYKDVSDVVNSAAAAGLSRKVAKLSPMICVKG